MTLRNKPFETIVGKGENSTSSKTEIIISAVYLNCCPQMQSEFGPAQEAVVW